MRGDIDRAVDLAFAQDLDRPLEVLDQTRSAHDLGCNFISFGLGNVPNIEDLVMHRVPVEETDTALEWHAPGQFVLAALERLVRSRAGSGILTVVALTRALAFAGAMAAPYALAMLMGAYGRLQIV